MGFLNKLKNVFFEEEEVEVEEKVKKEKPIAKKVELPKKEKKKEEVEIEDKEEEIEAGETYTPKEKNNGFKFPVLLEDDLIEEEIKEPVKEKPKRTRRMQEEINYSDDIIENDIPYDNSYTRDLNSADYSLHEKSGGTKSFKPSPIISPIYGVLDKNYKKEEIRDKKETHPTFSFTNDKLDLDSVRRKAYGNDIAYDIENDIEEDYNDVEQTDEETTLDMTDANMTPVVEKVTVGDAEEYFADLGLEYNIDYKDNSKEKMTKRRSRVEKQEEVNLTAEENTFEEDRDKVEFTEKNDFDEMEDTELKKDIEEEPVVKEEKKRTRSKKTEKSEEVEIEDNLFDLIDSMYDEGE